MLIGVSLALVELAHHTAPTRREGWRNAQVMVGIGFAASALLAGWVAIVDRVDAGLPRSGLRGRSPTRGASSPEASSRSRFPRRWTTGSARRCATACRRSPRARDEHRQRPARHARLPPDRVRLARLLRRTRSRRSTQPPSCSASRSSSSSAVPSTVPSPFRQREADLSADLDHRQGRRTRRQRARPQIRPVRPVHARRRGGVHAARQRDLRPGPAHRHGAPGDQRARARAADQRRADAIRARDRDPRVPYRRGRPARAVEAARAT